MKRISPFIIVIVVAFLVTACGSSTPTQPAMTEAPVQPTATEAATEPAMTEAPTEPAATESVPVTGSTQVDITLADNTITASMTSFQVGVPYTFVITNTGRHAHNFNINPPVSTAGSLDAALNGALLAVPQDQLAPGASATVEFTFPDSAAGQQLEFSCLIRRHYEDGMRVDITVTK